MDPELTAYLESMFHNLTEQIVQSRQHAEQQNQETRKDLMAHAEQQNQETRKDLMAHAELLNQETRKDLMTHATQLNQETRVLIEALRHDLQGVADGVLTVNQKLDRSIADHEARLIRLERRML